MSHFGILSFPGTGHLHPLTALGRELASRGNRVTVFQVADVEPLVRAAGLGFHQIGGRDFPPGALRRLDGNLSRLHGEKAMHFVFDRIYQNSKVVLRDAPDAVWAEKIDGLIVDQTEFAGGSVAEFLGKPFVTAILTLPLNLQSDVPFREEELNEEPKGSRMFQEQCVNGLQQRYRLAQNRRLELINRRRRDWNLTDLAGFNPFDSCLAQISQLPAGFDFQNRQIPDCFYYTGPFFDRAGRKETPFPWHRLDPKRPLVFVSMGTLQNGVRRVFQLVAQASANFPVQTVISMGGGMAPEALGILPGDPIVVSYAPQLELLKRAAVTIFHGGLNTALESLAHGVPMIAIPVTFDQPGVGARLVRSGTGRMIPVHELTAQRLRTEINEVLSNPKYAAKAKILQKEIGAVNGLKRAGDIIESVLSHRTVSRSHRLAARGEKLTPARV